MGSVRERKAMESAMERRAFLAGMLSAGAAMTGLSACSSSDSANKSIATDAESMATLSLPSAQPDPASMFDVDANVNMATIDVYIESGTLQSAILRDMRLVDDPARYEAIGGDSKLSMMIEGFEVTPYPYIGSLQTLPVDGIYEGPKLFDVIWDETGEVISAKPNYRQSRAIVEELFPKDKSIILMCGGGGYAGMMRKLLIHLGWNSSKVYNIGGMWDYVGNHPVQLISSANPQRPVYYLWRAKMPIIDFATLA